ncbi:MAG: L,D-transpeptidase family protein [Arcobacteraceae bacterium]|nr:L,D-transpeptidase family protein [Arcobacteraceae bacterium]
MKINIYLLLSVISTHLFASYEYANLYKEKGIDYVQNQLEKELTYKDFWLNYLKDKDVSDGYYESVDYLLVCDSLMKKIDIFKNNTHKKQKVFESSVLTGKNTGAKLSEGDLRTPIGAYDLVEKLTKLDQFYGPLALVTSYPNTFDKINRKTGNGIWIHGVPFNGNRDPYTKGCIALDNDKLTTLEQTIDIDNSLLIIRDDAIDENNSKENIAKVLSNFYSWKEVWKNGDFDNYISYYSPNFQKTDGTNFEKFKAYKKSIFDKNEEKQIMFKDINVIPYPNEEKKAIFKIKYYQTYSTKNYHFKGSKELYVELIDEKVQILAEE